MRHTLIFLLIFLLLVLLTIGIGIENRAHQDQTQDQNPNNPYTFQYNPYPAFSRIESGNSQFNDDHLNNDIDKNFTLPGGGGYQSEFGLFDRFNQFSQNGDFDEYDNYYEDKNSIDHKDHHVICTALTAFLKKLKGLKSFLILTIKFVKLIKSLKIISLIKMIYNVFFWPVIILTMILKFLILILFLFIPIPIITTTVTSSKSFYPKKSENSSKDLIAERILKSINDDCIKRIFCEITTGIKYRYMYRNNQATHQSVKNPNKSTIERQGRKYPKNSSKSEIWENCTKYQCEIYF